MTDKIKGAVAEAVGGVEADLWNADKTRALNLYAQVLREVDRRMDALVSSLDIAGLSSGRLTLGGTFDAIEGHAKDIKARLTEQIRLRVLAEARAAEAEARALRAEEEAARWEAEAARNLSREASEVAGKAETRVGEE